MERQVMLWGSRLDQTYDLIQEVFTGIRDRLVMLRTEAEMLSTVWQGEAEADWERVLGEKLEALTTETEGIYEYLVRLKEQAALLVKTEEEIMILAEALS